jgi:hypothetical protein
MRLCDILSYGHAPEACPIHQNEGELRTAAVLRRGPNDLVEIGVKTGRRITKFLTATL